MGASTIIATVRFAKRGKDNTAFECLCINLNIKNAGYSTYFTKYKK